MTQVTINRLIEQFIANTDVIGYMPDEIQVLVAQFKYVTPNRYPPGPPIPVETKERNARFRCVWPDISELNPSYAEEAKKSPATARDYWGTVARAIAKDVTFEELI